MLVIPRIQAVSEGANSAARPKIADRATSGSNAFAKVLSGLIAPRPSAGVAGNSRGIVAGDLATTGKKPGKTSVDLRKNVEPPPNASAASSLAVHSAAVGTTRSQKSANPSPDGDVAGTEKKQDGKKQNRSASNNTDIMVMSPAPRRRRTARNRIAVPPTIPISSRRRPCLHEHTSRPNRR